MDDRAIEVVAAGPERRAALAELFGRAFVSEPMMRWPLGDHGDLAARLKHAFALALEGELELGAVREAPPARGAAIWEPPAAAGWDPQPWEHPGIGAVAEDGGERYRRFWEWIHQRTPDEPLWQLDSIAVDAAERRRGIGAALIVDGLARARGDGVSAFLSTGSPGNVPVYERFGFRLVETGEAPGGGPQVWFMRWDP